ncbi:MAG TPA: ACT domain-containing protein [Pseudonocardiaceae bacterium]|nr:ACT domain-containing protein [Pseudonocardiaceae bacterium]
MRKLALDLRPGEYTVLKLDPESLVASGLLASPGLVSVTRTPDELSVVCPSAYAPEAEQTEGGWRLLTVRGPFEFTLTGILAALAGALAAAGVPIFAVSTFDTDNVLVKGTDLDRAIAALREAGHEVTQ